MHEAARQGYAAGAGAYERGRPEYPAELLAWLRDALHLGPGVQTLDLGAGTGKFSRLALQTGASLCAVEPVAAMRERLAQALPAVSTLAGSAEALPLAGASVDAVVCAQAFHWFANETALREIHRVLRPGGRLGLIWNVRDERVDWVAAITALFEPYEGDAPRFHTGRWQRPFAALPGWFSPLRQQTFVHCHEGGFDEVIVARCLSVSFIAALPETERQRFEAQLRELPQRFDALRQPRIAFPYRTEAWVAERLEPLQ